MPEVAEKRSSCSFIFGKSHLHLLWLESVLKNFALFRITVSPKNRFQSSDSKTQNKSTQNPLFSCIASIWNDLPSELISLYASCLFEISTWHHARYKLKEKKEKGMDIILHYNWQHPIFNEPTIKSVLPPCLGCISGNEFSWPKFRYHYLFIIMWDILKIYLNQID